MTTQFKKGDKVVFTYIYAGARPGTKATVMNSYIPKKGVYTDGRTEYVTVYFGKNRTGQILKQTVPANVLRKMGQVGQAIAKTIKPIANGEVRLYDINGKFQEVVDIRSIHTADIHPYTFRAEKAGDMETVRRLKDYQKYKNSFVEIYQKELTERQIARDEIDDELKSNGYKLSKNLDGTINLYHGTFPENAKKILQTGELKDFTFFSHAKTHSAFGSAGAKGYGKEVLTIKVDPRDVDFNTGSGEFEAEFGLIRDTDGIWKSPKRIKNKSINNQIGGTVKKRYTYAHSGNGWYIYDNTKLNQYNFPTIVHNIGPLTFSAAVKLSKKMNDAEHGKCELRVAVGAQVLKKYNSVEEIPFDIEKDKTQGMSNNTLYHKRYSFDMGGNNNQLLIRYDAHTKEYYPVGVKNGEQIPFFKIGHGGKGFKTLAEAKNRLNPFYNSMKHKLQAVVGRYVTRTDNTQRLKNLVEDKRDELFALLSKKKKTKKLKPLTEKKYKELITRDWKRDQKRIWGVGISKNPSLKVRGLYDTNKWFDKFVKIGKPYTHDQLMNAMYFTPYKFTNEKGETAYIPMDQSEGLGIPKKWKPKKWCVIQSSRNNEERYYAKEIRKGVFVPTSRIVTKKTHTPGVGISYKGMQSPRQFMRSGTSAHRKATSDITAREREIDERNRIKLEKLRAKTTSELMREQKKDIEMSRKHGWSFPPEVRLINKVLFERNQPTLPFIPVSGFAKGASKKIKTIKIVKIVKRGNKKVVKVKIFVDNKLVFSKDFPKEQDATMFLVKYTKAIKNKQNYKIKSIYNVIPTDDYEWRER